MAARVVAEIPTQDGDWGGGVAAVSADGDYLISRAERTRHGALGAFELILHDDSAETVIRTGGGGVQPTGAALGDGHVVWMEKPGTQLNIDRWTLYRYDTARGEPVRLATAPRLEDGRLPPAPPGYTGPVIVGDRVFWAQVGGRRGAETVGVYGCRIDRCDPELVLPGAAYPVTDGARLLAVQVARYGEAVPAGQARVVSWDPSAQRRAVELTADLAGRYVTGLAASGNHIAYILSGRREDRMRIVGPMGALAAEITSGRRVRFGYPVAGAGRFLWAESSGTSPLGVGGFAFDLGSGELTTVGNASGFYGLEAAGRFVSFQRTGRKPGAFVTVVARLR